MKLGRRQKCPIHHSYFCCGRESLARRSGRHSRHKKQSSKWQPIAPGVWRIADPHHARGYREKRSTAAMARLVDQKIIAQNGICALCGKEFTDRREVVGEHKTPKGIGGAWRDDHPDNIQAAHNFPCNTEKGSRRIS